MRAFLQIVGFTVLLALIGNLGISAKAEEVPFTLEDRDRLIRIEATLKEFKDSVDKRFEQIDKRFEQVDKRFEQVDKRFADVVNFMWLLGSVLGGLVAVTIGFAVWDRRTALTPALRRSQAAEDQGERITQALREMAKTDQNVADALRHVGLL